MTLTMMLRSFSNLREPLVPTHHARGSRKISNATLNRSTGRPSYKTERRKQDRNQQKSHCAIKSGRCKNPSAQTGVSSKATPILIVRGGAPGLEVGGGL